MEGKKNGRVKGRKKTENEGERRRRKWRVRRRTSGERRGVKIEER